MASPNQRLGEYVLIDPIGQGAFGEVWRARHHAWMDQIVAIKIPTDPQYVRNLQKEGHAIHQLSHPCIVKAISFDPYADPAYLVMEYVPGWSLRQVIQLGPMAATDAVSVMKQVLAALHHAHTHGMVHRDIKPENILIHQKVDAKGFAAPGAVKLTDFGVGQVAAETINSIVMSQDRREARQIVGSAQYMAPEQRDGEQVDARADLYSCGIVLFEMLTGKRPAGAEMPSELNPQVPPALDEVFRRAFARKERRFGSAADFFHALEPAAVPAPPPEPATQKPIASLSRTARKKSSKSRTLLIGVVAAAILAFAAVLVFLWPPTNDQPAIVSSPAPVVMPSPATVEAPVAIAPARVIPPTQGRPINTPVNEPTSVLPATQPRVITSSAPAMGPPLQPHVVEQQAETSAAAIAAQQSAESEALAAKAAGAATADAEATAAKAQEAFNNRQYREAQQAWVSAAQQYSKARLTAANGFWHQGMECYYGFGGRYLTPDFPAALVWFRRAADAGDPKSMTKLGDMYAKGQAVGKDSEQAASWYRKAAALGDDDAKQKLADIGLFSVATGPAGVPSDDESLHHGAVAEDSGERPPGVVLVCDATGSMMDKIDAQRHVIQQSIANYQADQDFSVIFFQEANSDHSEDFVTFSRQPVTASEASKRALSQFLDSVHPRGGTNPAPALRAAMALHPSILYFMVDPGDFPDKPGVLHLLRQLNSDHKTKVFTIGFFDRDPADEQFLDQLAKENDGSFRMIQQGDIDQHSVFCPGDLPATNKPAAENTGQPPAAPGPGLDSFDNRALHQTLQDRGDDSLASRLGQKIPSTTLPAQQPAQNPHAIDLLQLIDPQQDTVNGHWLLHDGELISDNTDGAAIEIPYRPPAEYDFEISYTRADGNNGIAQICSEAGHSFYWQMGGWNNRFAGFESIDGFGADRADKNASQVILALETGRRYTSLVKVRKQAIMVYLDGKLLTRWTTDYHEFENLGLPLRHSDRLGLGAWKSTMIIHSARLTEITGVGERLRKTAAPDAPGQPTVDQSQNEPEATRKKPAAGNQIAQQYTVQIDTRAGVRTVSLTHSPNASWYTCRDPIDPKIVVYDAGGALADVNPGYDTVTLFIGDGADPTACTLLVGGSHGTFCLGGYRLHADGTLTHDDSALVKFRAMGKFLWTARENGYRAHAAPVPGQ